MAITQPNKFSVPMMTYDVISRLALVNDHNFSAYVKDYPEVGLADSYIMKMEATGASKYSPTLKWKQWKDNTKQQAAFTITANATGGSAGATSTVTLTSASHYNSGKLSPVSVGQIWMNSESTQEYEVTAVSKSSDGAHTATLKPTKASVTIAITAATDTLILVGRNSVKEASGQQDGVYPTWSKVDRELQAIRTNKSYSDLAMFEKLELDGRSFYTIDKTNLEKEHIITQELTFMMGDAKDNLTEAAGNRNTAAKGVIPTIKSEGTDLTGSTALDSAYFKAIYRNAQANGYSQSYDVLHGPEFYLKYQDFLKNDSLDLARVLLDKDSGKISALFDFSNEVEIYGVKISLKSYKYFNQQLMAGIDQQKGYYNAAAVFIPTGTHYNEDASDNVPYLRVRYLSEEEGGERTKLMKDGGLLGIGTDAKADLALLSWKGVEMYAPKAFMFGRITS